MLTFAEEILLLALDDQMEAFMPLPPQVLKLALSGAFLLELAISGHIDTDLETLRVIRTTPTGNPLLDEALVLLQKSQGLHSTGYWLKELVWNMPQKKERVLQALVEKGVLKVENHKILWVFTIRRYPMMDGKEVQEVRSRLRDLITGDAIPDPRDAVLVGLVHACHLFENLFTREERQLYAPRIENLARLELIGREVNRAITNASIAFAESMSASISGMV
ncbi:GPP34 family phosphoprotein [Desulfobotulus sp. H1]|uniref:GPP34 family phosphoprotein n=1 Tax=Desulfobotulus pelophilus TaxID=2823377 RepID=A0ABT3N9X0_9BACT|nr:GPP34 family phosphoprotein [Desulfobotulus pelophilus]MCW7754230.1 GPP34 family phosphoprotein [Desulfobotulus pelophilus]